MDRGRSRSPGPMSQQSLPDDAQNVVTVIYDSLSMTDVDYEERVPMPLPRRPFVLLGPPGDS
eukprot:6837558-Pyramimonas_sp.AAC.1